MKLKLQFTIEAGELACRSDAGIVCRHFLAGDVSLCRLFGARLFRDDQLSDFPIRDWRCLSAELPIEELELEQERDELNKEAET